MEEGAITNLSTEEIANERELLKKIAANTGKQLFYTRITCIAACVAMVFVVICLLILVPKVVSTVAQVDNVLEEATVTIALADEAIQSITEMSDSITAMGENMDSFITDNAQAVAEVMEKIGAVDFEALNKGIKDLSDVIEPLANFFNRFK